VAISRASNSSIQGGLPKFNDIWDGTTATSAFDSLGSVVLSANTSSITFSNIPQTYTHLQIRFSATGGSAADAYIQLGNGTIDTGANYSSHQVRGNQSSGLAQSYSYATQNQMVLTSNIGQSAIYPNTGVCEILDYTNTNKFKTLRCITGYDLNGSSGEAIIWAGSWRQAGSGTTAKVVDTIKLTMSTSSFQTNSIFSLYGVK
jgi:hypothetical protein